jgi:hypothetical protein
MLKESQSSDVEEINSSGAWGSPESFLFVISAPWKSLKVRQGKLVSRRFVLDLFTDTRARRFALKLHVVTYETYDFTIHNKVIPRFVRSLT